jgi:SAM-dependent methyltransferase
VEGYTDRPQLRKDGSVAPRAVPICDQSRNACLLSLALVQDSVFWTSQPETGSKHSWPRGSWATDIADRLLAYLDEAARKEGLTNVQTRLTDARRLELEPESFDAAICRLALMLIPEREKALAGIHSALKPGTRFAAIVLSTAEKEPHIGESLAIARRHVGLPPAPFEDPGMFALGDPAVFRSVFERAGFREVGVEIVPSSQRFASVTAAMEQRRNSLPEMRQLLERMSEVEREAVWKEIETVIRRFEQSDGTVIIPTERLVAVGTK